LKNKKLKQTAIFIGIFLAAILLTFIFVRVFRPPLAPEEPTSTVETTTTWEESTSEEESSTTNPESTIVPATDSVPTTTARDTATTSRSTARTTATPPRTTIPPTTTRAPAITTKAPATTTRPTTTRAPTTTTRPPTTTTRPSTTTTVSDSLIAYGIDYGKSIGLTYRPQLTQGGEAVGATQQAIRDKLGQAKAAGATQFNVWAERRSTGYTIYISTGR